MINVLKLEEMLDWIGRSVSEETVMTTEEDHKLLDKCRGGFIPPEYFPTQRARLKHGFFDYAVCELLKNAVEHGNEGDKSLPATLRVYRGEHGIVAEVTDAGPGIPLEKIQRMMKEDYRDDCIYEDEERHSRGGGFHTLRVGLDAGTFTAIGFNERRNAIYLMALF